MNKITHNFTLDVAKDTVQHHIKGCVNGETSAREVAISLCNGETPIELTNDSYQAYILIRKPNNDTPEVNACQIDGNRILYTFESTDLAEGVIVCQLNIIKSDMIHPVAVYSPLFDVTVSASISDASVTTTNQYTALQNALAQAAAYAAETIANITIEANDVINVVRNNGDVTQIETLKTLADKLLEVAGVLSECREATEAAENISEAIIEAASQGGTVSFNGRSGIVVPQNGDYTASMVGAVAEPNLPSEGNVIIRRSGAWTAQMQNAQDVVFDPGTSGIVSTTVKGALIELKHQIQDKYDNANITVMSATLAENIVDDVTPLAEGNLIFVYDD